MIIEEELPHSPASYLPLLTETGPETAQLLGGLDQLQCELSDLCTKLDFDLLDCDSVAGCPITPFVTPLQQFDRPAVNYADTQPSVLLPPVHLLSAVSAENPDEVELLDFDDMSNLQLAVVGSNSNRWDGSQGPGYWRKRPTMKEAIAVQLRTRGGHMQAADQLGVLENQIEPVSGAFDWLQQMKKHLAADINNAAKDIFPSANLTDELAQVALGHLATDDAYLMKLRVTLAEALPLAHISTAGEYTPSRASGMLVPVPRAAVLTPLEKAVKEDLEQALLVSSQEQRLYNAKYGNQAQLVQDKQGEIGRLQGELEQLSVAASLAAHAPSADFVESPSEGAAVEPGAPDSIATDIKRVTESLEQAEGELEEAELRLQELGKLSRGVLTAKLQMMQQLKQYEATQHRGSAEVVKAFMHPTLGRICTAHDCVLLKVFAIMDVVYGIGTALQQVKFAELKQGKGVGCQLMRV